MINISDLSETSAVACAIRYGHEVAMLWGNSRRFDFLIETKKGIWLKVQVKTARIRKGQPMVDTRRSKQVTSIKRERKYIDGDFDLLVAVWTGNYPGERTPTIWVIPFKFVRGKTCLNLKPGWVEAWPNRTGP